MVATDNPASRNGSPGVEALIPTTFTGMPILGRPKKVTVDLPRSPGLDALRAAVEPLLYGGRLEHVSVVHEGRPTDMFVGENSAFVGNVRNDKATKIYRASWMGQHPKDDPETLPRHLRPNGPRRPPRLVLRSAAVSVTNARQDKIIDEAVAVANGVQAVVAGHSATACAVAIGWVIGAVAAHGNRGQIDLDELDLKRDAAGPGQVRRRP